MPDKPHEEFLNAVRILAVAVLVLMTFTVVFHRYGSKPTPACCSAQVCATQHHHPQ